MGVYLLIVVGATTSLTEAGRGLRRLARLWERRRAPDGDRGLDRPRPPAARSRSSGALVALSAVLAWRDGASRRIRAALTAALLVYPAQAGVGALVAVGSLPAALGSLHLLLGVAIFAAVLAGLAWWLEAETGDPDDVPVDFQPGTDDLPPVEDAPEPDVPTATVPGCGRLRRRTSG